MHKLNQLLRAWVNDPTTENAIALNDFANSNNITRGQIFASEQIKTLGQKKLFAEQIKNALQIMSASVA